MERAEATNTANEKIANFIVVLRDGVKPAGGTGGKSEVCQIAPPISSLTRGARMQTCGKFLGKGVGSAKGAFSLAEQWFKHPHPAVSTTWMPGEAFQQEFCPITAAATGACRAE